MLYRYAIPRALPQYKDRVFDGELVYKDHEVRIPASMVDGQFQDGLVAVIHRLSADTPPRKTPSGPECRYCDISQDCPERVAAGVLAAVTSDF